MKPLNPSTTRRLPATTRRAMILPGLHLSHEQRDRLRRLFTEPVPVVEHPSFRERQAEKRLFGDDRRAHASAQPWCNAALDGRDRAAGISATLTTAQEQRLFQRLNYARWRLTQHLSRAGRRLTRREVGELLLWDARAEETRTQIVQANMPLVLAMAKRTRLGNIDFAELISEGNMALLRSVDKFDWSRGFKFSTYACRAIIKSFSRVAMRCSRYRGRFPTEFDPALEKSDYLDRCRVEDESNCVDELRSIMNNNLAALNDVEQKVIRARFALDAPPNPDLPPQPKTLEEVGSMIGVTKERVRQIQNRALAKLRAALEASILAA